MLNISLDLEKIYRETNFKPYTFQGKVIKGYGRGSKELNCPTANISLKNELNVPLGVYWGLASIEDDKIVYGMVMNIGWCPYYKNKEKSIEVHILNTFKDDFYDKKITVHTLGYIRNEANFNTLSELKKAIEEDISYAKKMLNTLH